MAGDRKMHVVMFPWLAFGHMIPYLELAKFIARKGHKVSFLSTPRNILRFPNLPPDLAIDFISLSLPHVDQLPNHAEATTDLCSSDIQFLEKAFDGLEPELTRFLQNSSPDWIIYDFVPHWLPPIAATAPEELTTTPKWIPFSTKVAYHIYEAKQMLQLFPVNRNKASQVSAWLRFGSTISGCDVIAIRNCREFEPGWLTILEELHQKPVVPVGLMPPSVEETSGDPGNEKWVLISEWLSKQKSRSLVYVALGSEVTLSPEKFTELALGLELSGLPFFWAIKKPPGSSELPNGFEERTSGQGVVWTSWAPQLRILSHDSVGGFLTHCGWGSIIEGIQFGQPLVMLPFGVDQVLFSV
ncbi:UDP-rhamnose:rhamnosyltransferase [Actinidia chinensis var. chinensis]|uniref:UDP-rhamnose:rhamnosyltransferase n=1 Tax=Actinidia chinensis var. chinensis TaxID=1590841 RepID=A0A2R6S356_ACTCC|nr:UDP-rhamnose:rhamnosyltransferase [Actinidia chinensis var. chinensis]